MATRQQVTCINKKVHDDPHEHITHIGGKDSQGKPWKTTQQEAIKKIENGQGSYYVEKGGKHAEVVVRVSRYGHKYIRTATDDTEVDNLLHLPECK